MARIAGEAEVRCCAVAGRDLECEVDNAGLMPLGATCGSCFEVARRHRPRKNSFKGPGALARVRTPARQPAWRPALPVVIRLLEGLDVVREGFGAVCADVLTGFVVGRLFPGIAFADELYDVVGTQAGACQFRSHLAFAFGAVARGAFRFEIRGSVCPGDGRGDERQG